MRAREELENAKLGGDTCRDRSELSSRKNLRRGDVGLRNAKRNLPAGAGSDGFPKSWIEPNGTYAMHFVSRQRKHHGDEQPLYSAGFEGRELLL